jgi:YgiT-type zinc finger domain-containing protein
MVRASILIKSNDQHEYLEQSFPIIKRQTEQSYEIIFLYSGSNEATVELAEESGAKVIKIEPSEFSHSRALNRGASEAQGEFLVFLSADAVPASDRWLESLLQRFDDPTVAGVYGRHTPRRGVPLSLLDRVRIHMRYGTDGRFQKDNNDNLFSNANSAIRKRLWEQHHFDERLREVEDYEWSRWAQSVGYQIRYEPEAAAEHTHGEQYHFVPFLVRAVRFKLIRRQIDGRVLTEIQENDSFTDQRNNGTNKSNKSNDTQIHMPSSRKEFETRPGPATTIEVASEHDPSLRIICPFDGTLTVQKRIDYHLTLNNQIFEIPHVWASVCSKCNEAFFAEEVSNAIMEEIFAIQHPERVHWSIH